jgi:hypothetical protein
MKGIFIQALMLLALAPVAYSKGMHEFAMAGTSYCDGAPEPGQGECVLAWEFEGIAPKKVSVEKYDTRKEEWKSVRGYKNIDASKRLTKPVEPLTLYRVTTCGDRKGSRLCYTTTATWAVAQPASDDDIPEFIDYQGAMYLNQRDGDYFGRHQIHNIILLNQFLDEVQAKDRLIPMTKPAVRIDPVMDPGLTAGEILNFTMYEMYELFRDKDEFKKWLDAWRPNWREVEMMGYRGIEH